MMLYCETQCLFYILIAHSLYLFFFTNLVIYCSSANEISFHKLAKKAKDNDPGTEKKIDNLI